MKNRFFILLAGIIIISAFTVINAQDCALYFPDKVGAMREMKFYDAKNKLSSISRQEIIDKTESGNDIMVKVKATNYTAGDEEVYSAELNLICEDGVFKFDMQSMLDPNTMAAYNDMGVEVTADNLIYPPNMKVGDNLPDGNMKMTVKSDQLTLLTITISVSNRKIEAKEDVNTEAGTFKCYRIKYDTMSKVGFITKSGSVTEWIAEGVGVVRNESFNKKGKSEGYSVLTAFKN